MLYGSMPIITQFVFSTWGPGLQRISSCSYLDIESELQKRVDKLCISFWFPGLFFTLTFHLNYQIVLSYEPLHQQICLDIRIAVLIWCYSMMSQHPESIKDIIVAQLWELKRPSLKARLYFPHSTLVTAGRGGPGPSWQQQCWVGKVEVGPISCPGSWQRPHISQHAGIH